MPVRAGVLTLFGSRITVSWRPRLSFVVFFWFAMIAVASSLQNNFCFAKPDPNPARKQSQFQYNLKVGAYSFIKSFKHTFRVQSPKNGHIYA